MKITFISPYPDITAFGIRNISSYVKEHGHKTQIIFLPDPCGDDIADTKRYNDSVLEGIIPLCADADIIGVTLMTNFYQSAIEITEKIKRLKKPVIWGGVHATVMPEQCLMHADMVCIGDGEEVMLELLNRMERREDYDGVRGLCVKRDGNIIRNPLERLSDDLDKYPIPDYSMENHFVMHNGAITAMTTDLMRTMMEESYISNFISKCGYQTMSGRGCPHKCSYCVNDTLKNMYGGHDYLRWRSPEHVVEELLFVKKTMPFVGHIWFSDDSFFSRNLEKTKEFCKLYKEKIGLPFFALGSPLTINEEKMALLVDTGLRGVQMGIQTGSSHVQALFNRKNMSNERVLKAMNIINKYKDRLEPPHYDFILDTPYETDRDKVETLRFISRIPKPYNLQTFSLVLYPGTQMYDMAKKDGFINDEEKEILNRSYTRRSFGYFNVLFSLIKKGWLPVWTVRILISGPVLLFLNNKFMVPVIKAADMFAGALYRTLNGLCAPKVKRLKKT
ncbi:MAG: B12-binding domain-containing radical SAM protein [Nitrospirae bacterium]|nr:B12-binding domain-containing radical SAM protein [Nitrospirota bacterium]